MRADVAEADRMHSVRDAARGWFRAGWIDENTRLAVEAVYPDDRVRSGLAFRILFFVLTLVAIHGVAGVVAILIRYPLVLAIFALSSGLFCAAATDYLMSSLKRSQGGIEAAFSFAAILGFLTGLTVLLLEIKPHPDRSDIVLMMILCALIWGGGAWLWGYWPYAVLSACFLFYAVIILPAGGLLWVLGAATACPPLVSYCDWERLPPSLRKASAAFLAVAILASYAIVNVFSLDHHLIQQLSAFPVGNEEFMPRWLSIALTAALPPGALLIGVLQRRRLFLNLGFLMAILSLITLRFYFHIAPPWVVLTGAGLVLLATAAGLRRLLDSGAGAERGGFTAAPLTEDPAKRRTMEVLAGVATLTPGPAPEAQKPEFSGGGGEFGGGGASGDF